MSYDIRKVLSNGKESFYRVLPNVLETSREGTVGNIPASLPNLQVENFTQARYLQELNPSGHKIFNTSVYPDKWIEEKDAEGNVTSYRCENITRIAVPFQRIIASSQKIHITGNPLKFTLTNALPTKENNETFTNVKQGWLNHNFNTAFSECVESQLTTGDCAIYLFRESGILDWQTFSYAKGDLLMPIFKDNGKLKILYRYFSSRDDNNKVVEAMNVFDEQFVWTYRKDKFKWIEVGQVPHGCPEVPCVYKRGKVAWDDVQPLIEEFEWSFSSFCEGNAYFSNTIMFAKGDITMMPSKNTQGKLIVGSEGSDAKYLEKSAGSAETHKLQFDILEKKIYMGAFYVDISPENVPSGGDLPGVAIRLLMTPEINKAIELSQEWDEFVDTLVRLFLYFYGLEQKNSTKVNELAIRSEIDIYTPENTTEVVNILNSSKTMKTLSTKTAAERHPYATNDEVERLQDEAKAEADLTASTVQTGMNENNLQQSLLNE